MGLLGLRSLLSLHERRVSVKNRSKLGLVSDQNLNTEQNLKSCGGCVSKKKALKW